MRYAPARLLGVAMVAVVGVRFPMRGGWAALANVMAANGFADSAGAPAHFRLAANASSGMGGEEPSVADIEYPGTAVARLQAVQRRIASLTAADLSQPWEKVRSRLLWAGGLRDLPDAAVTPPGAGYTGHAFNGQFRALLLGHCAW